MGKQEQGRCGEAAGHENAHWGDEAVYENSWWLDQFNLSKEHDDARGNGEEGYEGSCWLEQSHVSKDHVTAQAKRREVNETQRRHSYTYGEKDLGRHPAKGQCYNPKMWGYQEGLDNEKKACGSEVKVDRSYHDRTDDDYMRGRKSQRYDEDKAYNPKSMHTP